MNREMAAIGEGKGGDLLDAKNEMLKRMCDMSGSTVGSCWDRPSVFAGIDRKLQGELC
jgi:hypothetical protein